MALRFEPGLTALPLMLDLPVPAKNNLAKLDQALKDAGLKGSVVIMMGGAAVKKEDADAIGALFGKNKEEGVEIAKKAIAGKKK